MRNRIRMLAIAAVFLFSIRPAAVRGQTGVVESRGVQVKEDSGSSAEKGSGWIYVELDAGKQRKTASKSAASVSGKYYTQLSAYGKKLYKSLKKKNLTGKAVRIKQSYTLKYKKKKIVKQIVRSSKFKKFDLGVQNALYAYRLDHMEKCYWLSDLYPLKYAYKYQYRPGKNKQTIFQIKSVVIQPVLSYANALKDLPAVRKKLDQIAGTIKATRHSTSRYSTLYTLARYMTEHFSYGNKQHDVAYTPAALLLDQYDNTGVCEAYAKVCFILCKKLGIPVIYAESERHAYNFVKMGDGKWYGLDTNWIDDNNPENPSQMDLRWFLYGEKERAENDLRANHVTQLRWGAAALEPIEIASGEYPFKKKAAA